MPRAKAYKPDLDFKRVEKYVRRAPALLLPTGWRDWLNGLPPLKHKLPIDDELAQLPSGRKRILSADEVRARHPTMNWPSHEIAIRFQLVWYVVSAEVFTQLLFLLQRRFAVPILFQQVFHVLRVHTH